MLSRTILSGTVLLAMLGALAATADAGDWSVSVSLGSGSSGYYSLGGDSYYSSSRAYSLGSDSCRTYTYVPSSSYVTTTSYTPSVSYAPSVSYVPMVGYLPSVSYVDYDYGYTPATTRYSSCRSVPYTTTYTRSACYSEPVRHRRVVHRRSNHHRTVRMPYYSTPRVSDRSSRRVVRSHSSPRTVRSHRTIAPRRSDCSSRRVIRTHRTSTTPRHYMHRGSPPRSHRHGHSSHRTPRIRVRHR